MLLVLQLHLYVIQRSAVDFVSWCNKIAKKKGLFNIIRLSPIVGLIFKSWPLCIFYVTAINVWRPQAERAIASMWFPPKIFTKGNLPLFLGFRKGCVICKFHKPHHQTTVQGHQYPCIFFYAVFSSPPLTTVLSFIMSGSLNDRRKWDVMFLLSEYWVSVF